MLRGHAPESLTNLTVIEQMFYSVTMENYYKEEEEKLMALASRG
jgi:hypothetical protein